MFQIVEEKALDYDSFVATVRDMVRERMGEGYDIHIYRITKNNSLEMDSLVILKEGKNFAPHIYFKPYYESYLAGTSVEDIAGRLCCIYNHCSVPLIREDFSYALKEMKPFIFYRVVNYERNRMLLLDIPHIRYHDLAVTYHCLVQSDEEGIGTIRISNAHMKQWGITLKELRMIARANTAGLFPAIIKRLEEVLGEAVPFRHKDGPQEDIPKELNSLLKKKKQSVNMDKIYVLTNNRGINGASCILYEDILEQFAAKINSDLFILPSSIHEVLLVPETGFINSSDLILMVREVNATQVAAEEVLSDNIYLYSRESKSVTLLKY